MESSESFTRFHARSRRAKKSYLEQKTYDRDKNVVVRHVCGLLSFLFIKHIVRLF
jgi:hypothetical protein